MIYLKLFVTFFQIGIFGFGGGMAMLPVIYQTALRFQLMDAEEFGNLVAVSQVTPGPIAVNAATYVGYNSAGVPGAFFATLGIGVPSFLLVTVTYKCIRRWSESRTLADAFEGVRPVTAGLILAAAFFLGRGLIGPGGVTAENAAAVGIFAGAFGLMVTRRVPAIVILVGAGIAGSIVNGVLL